MKEQVLTIEQMKHLQELGLYTSNASMCWNLNIRKYRNETKYAGGCILPILKIEPRKLERVPTFTLQDILELLPEKISNKDNSYTYTLNVIFPNDGTWEILYSRFEEVREFFCNESLLNAAYEMLCWCIENGYVPTKTKQNV